jgi:hypothetical protein
VSLCLRERLSPKVGDLKGDLSNTSWIEGVEAVEGIEEMPDGGGVFFLEEFGIRGAAAFTDFLSDGIEELLRSVEYGIAAGIFCSGFAQQGVETFGGAIEEYTRTPATYEPKGRKPLEKPAVKPRRVVEI